MLENEITYCVYWRSTYNKEWSSFSPWFENYADAYEVMSFLSINPECIEAAVVEKNETFDFVARLEKKDGN